MDRIVCRGAIFCARTRTRTIRWITCIVLAVFNVASYAHCADLWMAYQDAVRNDPVFQAEEATLQEISQEVPIARSDLLPQLLLNAEYAHTYQQARVTGYNDFDSSQYSLNLTQPIFNANAFSQLQSAKASVQAAAMRFSAEEQSLMVRVVRAYLAVLEARDLLIYTKSQEKFTRHFYDMTRKRHKERFATITEMDQAKQQVRSLHAQTISAQINYDQAVENLADITATTYQAFPYFKKHTPIISPSPNKITTWIHQAMQHNLLLHAAELEVLAVKNQLHANKDNFLPTLSFFGNYTDANQLSTQNNEGIQNKVKVSEVGLRASWPLIQGGLTIAQVKQAKASYAKAVANHRKAFLDVVLNTRNAYRGVRDGRLRVRSAKYAVIDGLNGLTHTQAGFRAGVQTIFDLLQAQNRLFDSEKLYLNSFYEYILNTVLLKEANGSLSPHDIFQLNQFLTAHSEQSVTIITQSKKDYA